MTRIRRKECRRLIRTRRTTARPLQPAVVDTAVDTEVVDTGVVVGTGVVVDTEVGTTVMIGTSLTRKILIWMRAAEAAEAAEVVVVEEMVVEVVEAVAVAVGV